jgi:hypothetical protein
MELTVRPCLLSLTLVLRACPLSYDQLVGNGIVASLSHGFMPPLRKKSTESSQPSSASSVPRRDLAGAQQQACDTSVVNTQTKSLDLSCMGVDTPKWVCKVNEEIHKVAAAVKDFCEFTNSSKIRINKS